MDNLIVGLGNPGAQYQRTRHNVGFMVLERLSELARAPLSRSKFNAFYGTGDLGGKSVALLTPQTFMNASGRAVGPAAHFFQVQAPQIIVVHDDLDLPFGTLRLKVGGGHGGHNGLRSIMGEGGVDAGFVRLRFGIGRPAHGDPADYVLGTFKPNEQEWLPGLIDNAATAIEAVLRLGVARAMNQLNTPPEKRAKKEKQEGEKSAKSEKSAQKATEQKSEVVENSQEESVSKQ